MLDSRIISLTGLVENADIQSRLRGLLTPAADAAVTAIPELLGLLVLPVWRDNPVGPNQSGFIMSNNNNPDDRALISIKTGEVLMQAIKTHSVEMINLIGTLQQQLRQTTLDGLAAQQPGAQTAPVAR